MISAPAPPGPSTWRPLGSLPEFRRDPLAFVQGMADRHGDVVRYRFARGEVFQLNHPDLIRQVLVSDHRNYIKSRLLQRSRELLGDGLLTSEHDFHLRQRRMIQPSFHRDRIALYGSEMIAAADRLSARWEHDDTIDISQAMTRLTLEIAGKTLLGSDVDQGEADVIGSALTDALGLFDRMTNPMSVLLDRLPVPSTRRLEAARERLDTTIHRMIEERRADPNRGTDLLSTLLLAQDDEGDGKGMTNTQVRDEILTIFLAGHETTANALSWTWVLLSRHPVIEQRMHDEIDRVTGGAPLTVAHFPDLVFTRQILAESMRLFPPAWSIGRQPLEDREIGGFRVRSGSIVLMCPWVVHRDERFFPDASDFDPDRWTPAMEAALPKFAYFPFGGGPRKCIGEGFAWMEGILVLAALGQKWRARLVSDEPVVPRPLITLRLRDGAAMRLEGRVQQSTLV